MILRYVLEMNLTCSLEIKKMPVSAIDYSKWNNLSLSDDESDKDCQECQKSHDHRQQELLKELVTKQIQREQKCSHCTEIMRNDEEITFEQFQERRSNFHSSATPMLAKINSSPLSISASTSPKKNPQKLSGTRSIMPHIKLDFEKIEKPLPGMLTKMPKLSPQYANSPIQRMQYR